jgi:hypothetical protein
MVQNYPPHNKHIDIIPFRKNMLEGVTKNKRVYYLTTNGNTLPPTPSLMRNW